MIIHRAEKNESIYDIAREYCVSPMMIAQINGISLGTRLARGEELLILLPTKTYNAKLKENVGTVSEKFSIDKEEIMCFNPELGGRDTLYPGQLLTVKYDQPRFGSAMSNGYLYPGYKTERLFSALPFSSAVTVCAAISDGEGIRFVMKDKELVKVIKERRKAVFLRIYLERMPKTENIPIFTKTLAEAAQEHSYTGIMLTKPKEAYESCAFRELVLELKKILMQKDMLLFTEADSVQDCSHTEYSDGCVLFYDKLHLDKIPPFDKGERAVFSEYATKYESRCALIDLSSFVFFRNKYVSKNELRKIISRRGTDIDYLDEGKLLHSVRAGRKNDELFSESMENTKAKLELISELGYLGISFDIDRTPIYDLMMFKSMFAISSGSFMSGIC